MTIGGEAWNALEAMCGEQILPNYQSADTTIPPDLRNKKNVQLVCWDILANIRSSSGMHWLSSTTGDFLTITCETFLTRLFKPVVDTLATTDVDTYVICLDPFNCPRPEKKATRDSRVPKPKPGVPTHLQPPPAGQRYFDAKRPLPGTMNLIFNTPQARAEFYEFILEHLQTVLRPLIPAGKCVILSGGLHVLYMFEPGQFDPEKHVTQLAPVRLTHDNVEILEEHAFPSLSEGDLDVLRWVNVFPDKNFYIYSVDGDIFLIALMQMRRIIKQNPHRLCYFVTRRSVDSKPVDAKRASKKSSLREHQELVYERTLQETQSIDDAFRASGGVVSSRLFTESSSSKRSRSEPSSSSSSSSSSKRARSVAPKKEPVWLDRYINLVGVYWKFIDKGHELVETHKLVDEKGRPKCVNIAEVYVLAICLCSTSHDYIQPKLVSPGVGPKFIWRAFETYLHELVDLVRIYAPKQQPPHCTLYYYGVDVDVLTRFVQRIYEVKGIDNKKVTPTELHIVAAQSAWTLQYWGNGVYPCYNVVDGTIADANGDSIYGYTPKGWASSVVEAPIRFAPPIHC